MSVVMLACALAWMAVSDAAAKPMVVPIYSSAPAGLDARADQKASAERKGDRIVIANGFLSAEISARGGVIRAIENRVTGERHELSGDSVGVSVVHAHGRRESITSETRPRDFGVQIVPGQTDADARFILEDEDVRIIYDLAARDFWLRRRVVVERDRRYTVDGILYGALHVDGVQQKQLTLGKFDRPDIAHAKSGGLFAGVEHWFYRVDEEGTYRNDATAWEQTGRFEGEPWYVGVFADEAGEPYPGWAWYRTYLQRAKAAAARHETWLSWNAGWGQWGIDIDDPAAPQYLQLMQRLGIDGVIFGSGGFGKGIAKFAELADSDANTKANVATLRDLHIAGGTLNNGSKPWGDAEKFPALMEEFDRYALAGFRSTAFDFFESPDTYAAHRRVAHYFAAAREKLDYTECHLGMAAYGPQFQRMVRVNHPDDIHGFDISHFSSNWATFLAFRQSRRNWQKKYDYLMPEDGLYYYLTHYANWGNPRRYTDPEPQQFIWSVSAYCGIGFNFHDTFGWRESIAAASAFTTAPVFGHIELKMPERDVEYAKRFFAWMKENAVVLQPSRVCAETEDHCVVSKIRDGKGLIYVVNYRPGARDFELPLKTGHAGAISIRQVYPAREDAKECKNGDTLKVHVRGESTVILEVNGALKSLPPENRSRFPIDLSVERAGDSWTARFDMPDVRSALSAAADPALPRELLSLDQVQDTRPELLVSIPTDAQEKDRKPAVKWIGKGKLPQAFLDVYGFKDGQTVETWKIVPWAYADRVWLVVRPAKPPPLTGPHPTLKLNGTAVPLVPRVDHRFKEVGQWNCPLYHADVSLSVRFGRANELDLAIPGQSEPPTVYITSAADRN